MYSSVNLKKTVTLFECIYDIDINIKNVNHKQTMFYEIWNQKACTFLGCYHGVHFSTYTPSL